MICETKASFRKLLTVTEYSPSHSLGIVLKHTLKHGTESYCFSSNKSIEWDIVLQMHE
jgi:hypothetical protein